MKGKIRIDPKAAEHVIREGLVASGMMTRKLAQACSIGVSRLKGQQAVGILLNFTGKR